MTARLDLDASIGSADAQRLAQELRKSEGADLVVDACALAHLGALGAQTLVVAARTWAATGHVLTIENLPDEIRAQLADLGLDSADPFLTGACP